jgi:hypothetical protein
VQTLAATPGQAVPFLRKRLTPVPKADGERIDRLVEDLVKGNYNTRKRAMIELRKLGPAAFPALRRAQQKGFYDELMNRLFSESANRPLPPEQVRAVRALRVLEQIGNSEARKLLEELAAGAEEATLTVQAKAALDRLGKGESAKSEPAPAALWEALAAEDSAAAYQAIRALASRPATAALLRDRLKEVVSKDTFNDEPGRVAKLIGELDSKAFAVREQANKSLRNLGRLIVPALQKALAATEELEAKRRLEQLLDAATKTSPPAEMLRAGRALEALELMSGPEARQALEALAEDVQVPWLRAAVAESLRRQGGTKR